MSEFITKDSGERARYETGAVRDTQAGKPRFDLIPLWELDEMQMAYGGDPLEVDASNPPITGRVPAAEARYDLVPELMINRLAGLYHRGAVKYTDNNWQKGIPLSRLYASMFRHMIQWRAGDTSEDHLAAVLWNSTAIMWTETEIAEGRLAPELDDLSR